MSVGVFPYILFVACFVCNSSASHGDRSWIYQRCLRDKLKKTCSDRNIVKFTENQEVWLKLTQWSCKDECKYKCMWHTVEGFQKDNSPIPQFHGKWPFIRVLGMQEPASVVFSILNGLCHLRILQLHRYVPSGTRMFYVWHLYALVCMNAWLWSVIFHTRDTDFTEKMDYFAAYSIIVCNTFTLIARVVGTEVKRYVASIAAFCLCLYLQHIYYLNYVHFDYGYNMAVNIAVGGCNSVGWLAWCIKQRYKQAHVWKCAAVIVSLNILVTLELQDFAPIFWVFDAHSLWHAGTIPVTYLWYSYILDDGMYMSPTLLPGKLDTKKAT